METERAKENDKPMEESRRKTLITARRYLVTDVNVEEVLIRMPHVFTVGEEEKIKSMPTQQLKCGMFLDMLPTRGNNAYDVFKKALKEVSPHLISTLDQAAETTRERQKSAGVEGKLRSLQNEMEKIANERDELRKQLDRKSNINQERENSARLALECQDLKAKLEKEKEESKKIVDERDELRKQLEEKGKTRKTTEDENERRKTRAQGEKLRAIRKILDDDGNELPETRRMDEQQGIAAGGIALPDNANNQKQISPLGQVWKEASSRTAELDSENKVSKPSVEECLEKVYQRMESIKSLLEKVHQNHKFEADSERPRKKDTKTNQKPGTLPKISEVEYSKEITRESWILENGIFVPFDDNYSNSDVIKHLKLDASAKPCSAANSRSKIDLGDKYRLIVTHYTFEQQNNGSSDSSLQLEGSNDGGSWTPLNTTVMKNLNEMHRLKATWRVKGEMPGYRYFRAIQTDSTAAGISLSRIWLYGVLLQRSLPDKCPRK